MQIALNYNDSLELLRGAGIYGSPADVYGLLMGLIAGGYREEGRDFEELTLNLINDGEPMPRSVRTWQRETVSGIIEQYLSGEGMHLLLPGDGSRASERATALIELAHGFITGFSLRKQKKKDSELSREAREFIRDLSEYCRASGRPGSLSGISASTAGPPPRWRTGRSSRRPLSFLRITCHPERRSALRNAREVFIPEIMPARILCWRMMTGELR